MAEEEEEYKTRTTLAGIDKLDWRRRIETALWMCVQARGAYGAYHLEVLKIEDCICTNFYGLDFRTPIHNFIKKLNAALQTHIEDHLKTYRYKPQTIDDLTTPDKCIFVRKIYFQYWQHRFDYDRDLLAENRGLLWGSQKLPGGKQMADEGD